MTPTFMESPPKRAVLGAPGGSRIITEVLLGILAYDDGLTAEQVAALPRFHHQWLPDTVYVEPDAFDAATIPTLAAMRHTGREAGARGLAHTVAAATRTTTHG